MKASNLREYKDQELVERLNNLRMELFRMRFQAAAGQVENPMRLREVKKDIARILTIQGQRRRGSNS